MIIYKATNKINGKIYIGQTIKSLKKRIIQHKFESKNKSCYFHNALRKYGIDSFKWEILCECDNKLILNMMETFKIIVNHSHRSEGGYNLNWGGDGMSGFKHTIESKEKMSKSAKGRITTKETKKKMSESRKGKKHTDEWRRKQSEGNKKYDSNFVNNIILYRKNTLLSYNKLSIMFDVPFSTIRYWCNNLGYKES